VRRSSSDARGKWVTEVVVGEKGSLDTALKRVSRTVQQGGILAEARRREHFEKPSVIRKRKEATRARKAAKSRS